MLKPYHHAGTRKPKAKEARSHTPVAKTLVPPPKQPLGTHVVRGSATGNANIVPRLLGEPRGFTAVLTPTGANRPVRTHWSRQRLHHFKKRLHSRKPRRIPLGQWKRSRKVLKPR